VVASTAWPVAKAVVKKQLEYSTIFVDEAGQMPLANAVVCSLATRQLVLLGDPQQLPQIVQHSNHPDGSDESSLTHILGERAIVGDSHGVFIAESRRMHPDIADFISTNFYDGQMTSHSNCVNQKIDGLLMPLNLVRVIHENSRRRKSVEEANEVLEIVRTLLGRTWFHAFVDEEQILTQHDFLVVAPYRDQVRLIQRVLKRAGYEDVAVGTVDKFQGQEGAVVIYSLATTSLSDVHRGREFLLNDNRTNVAISRARAAVFMVASGVLISELSAEEGDSSLADFVRRASKGTGVRELLAGE
jgi:uncharacterized protein